MKRDVDLEMIVERTFIDRAIKELGPYRKRMHSKPLHFPGAIAKQSNPGSKVWIRIFASLGRGCGQ